MLTEAQWTILGPLIEACRPKGKTQPRDLRRTISAILWRHENGAKWRSVPAELGPWSRAAQTFIRWARLGVWERLLGLAQERGVELGMTFLDGTSIRAHQKAAGAQDRKSTRLNSSHANISYAVFCLKKKLQLLSIICAFCFSALLFYLYDQQICNILYCQDKLIFPIYFG